MGKELLWLDRLLSQSNRDLGVRDNEARQKMRIGNEGSKGSWIIHLEFFIPLSTFPLPISSSLIIHKAACGIHHRWIGMKSTSSHECQDLAASLLCCMYQIEEKEMVS
jgi:hypothetical protein